MTYLFSPIPLPRLHRSYTISVFFLLLTAAWGFANSETPKAKNSPCGLAETEAAELNEDASVSVHAVTDYSNAIHRLLQSGRFEQLDCLAESARAHKEFFPGGMWKIHAIYFGLAKPPLHPTQEDWTAHLELLQRWASARPESITARIALAKSYVNYG